MVLQHNSLQVSLPYNSGKDTCREGTKNFPKSSSISTTKSWRFLLLCAVILAHLQSLSAFSFILNYLCVLPFTVSQIPAFIWQLSQMLVSSSVIARPCANPLVPCLWSQKDCQAAANFIWLWEYGTQYHTSLQIKPPGKELEYLWEEHKPTWCFHWMKN